MKIEQWAPVAPYSPYCPALQGPDPEVYARRQALPVILDGVIGKLGLSRTDNKSQFSKAWDIWAPSPKKWLGVFKTRRKLGIIDRGRWPVSCPVRLRAWTEEGAVTMVEIGRMLEDEGVDVELIIEIELSPECQADVAARAASAGEDA